MKAWYIIHTLSGAEEKAKANLEARIKAFGKKEIIDQVIIPKEQVTEIKLGKKRVLKRKVFPGYILVHMEMKDDMWLFVKKTPGITTFIGPAKKPMSISEEEVEKILKRAQDTESKPLPKVTFSKNETVRVVEGPFVNFNGVVEDVNLGRGKLRVSITIFGRTTPVELEFWQVEKI